MIEEDPPPQQRSRGLGILREREEVQEQPFPFTGTSPTFDDDNNLNLPDVTHTVHWCTTLQSKSGGSKSLEVKEIDNKNAAFYQQSDSFRYESWRHKQSKLCSQSLLHQRRIFKIPWTCQGFLCLVKM